jgi:hypothetical protein
VLAHTALAPGNLPGKFFEYLASGNFIFGVGPSAGDAAHILGETSAGLMLERDNREGIKALLRQRLETWVAGGKEPGRNVQAYSRKNLTGKLINIIKSTSQ